MDRKNFIKNSALAAGGLLLPTAVSKVVAANKNKMVYDAEIEAEIEGIIDAEIEAHLKKIKHNSFLVTNMSANGNEEILNKFERHFPEDKIRTFFKFLKNRGIPIIIFDYSADQFVIKHPDGSLWKEVAMVWMQTIIWEDNKWQNSIYQQVERDERRTAPAKLIFCGLNHLKIGPLYDFEDTKKGTNIKNAHYMDMMRYNIKPYPKGIKLLSYEEGKQILAEAQFPLKPRFWDKKYYLPRKIN